MFEFQERSTKLHEVARKTLVLFRVISWLPTRAAAFPAWNVLPISARRQENTGQ